jgi:hypothetical protein
MDLNDIYRTFHPTAIEHTFFSEACGTFSKIDCMIDQKQSVSKFQRIEITLIIFSNHDAIKLEIDNKKTLENIQMHIN